MEVKVMEGIVQEPTVLRPHQEFLLMAVLRKIIIVLEVWVRVPQTKYTRRMGRMTVE